MRRLAIVLNPDSGKDETSQSEITKLFSPKQLDLKFFAITKGIPALRKSIQDYAPQAVVAVGGDGTVNAVATIAIRLDLPMGVIPSGTLNHFAKDMGLPTDPAQAAAIIAKQRLTKIDYGSINERMFVNNCNLGAYPEIVLKRDKLTIPNKWLAGAIAAIQVRLQHRRQIFEMSLDGVHTTTRAGSLFIGNNCYQLQGAQFTTRKQLDKGVLQLVIIKTGRIRHLARILVGFIMGRPHEKVGIHKAQQIVITSPRQQYNVAVDGEVVRLDMPLTITTHPKALTVLV